MGACVWGWTAKGKCATYAAARARPDAGRPVVSVTTFFSGQEPVDETKVRDWLIAIGEGRNAEALLKLEQEGAIVGEWGVSENNRKARFYRLTAAGRRQLARETRQWEQATAILARFLAAKENPA